MKLTARINRFLSVNLQVRETLSGEDKDSCEVRVQRSEASSLIGPGTPCELTEERGARKLVVLDVRQMSDAVHIFCSGRVS